MAKPRMIGMNKTYVPNSKADQKKLCPEFEKELVPMCVRNGGVCHEIFPCGERKKNG